MKYADLMRDNQLFSPKEIGHALGVSEASIKRWVDKGKIGCIKTSGGHRKIPLHALVEYLHTNKAVLVNPEAVSIPDSTGRKKDKMAQSALELQSSFNACDEHTIRGIIYDLYLAGTPLHKIFDELLAPALHKLGCDWEDGTVDAFQERRTIQICIRTLYGFETFFPPPEDDAPVALLGTLSGDPYTVPVLMVEVCLRAIGWRTEFLGNDLPGESYVKAIEMYKPALTAISISAKDQETAGHLQLIEKKCRKLKSGLLVGGRAVPSGCPDSMPYTFFAWSTGNMLDELESYLKAL